jgi:hypothetical protein
MLTGAAMEHGISLAPATADPGTAWLRVSMRWVLHFLKVSERH